MNSAKISDCNNIDKYYLSLGHDLKWNCDKIIKPIELSDIGKTYLPILFHSFVLQFLVQHFKYFDSITNKDAKENMTTRVEVFFTNLKMCVFFLYFF